MVVRGGDCFLTLLGVVGPRAQLLVFEKVCCVLVVPEGSLSLNQCLVISRKMFALGPGQQG